MIRAVAGAKGRLKILKIGLSTWLMWKFQFANGNEDLGKKAAFDMKKNISRWNRQFAFTRKLGFPVIIPDFRKSLPNSS